MVQPRRVGSPGLCPVLLSDPRLRGPPGTGAGPVLEARRVAPAFGSQGFVSGHFVHGTVPRQSIAAAGPTTRTLLRAFLCQICHGASGCDGACARAGSPGHSQEEERLRAIVRLPPLHEQSRPPQHLKCPFQALHGRVEDVVSFTTFTLVSYYVAGKCKRKML